MSEEERQVYLDKVREQQEIAEAIEFLISHGYTVYDQDEADY